MTASVPQRRIWLFSDWHWQHKNLYQFTNADGLRVRREFQSAEEGDAFIEQAIRDVVKPHDHIWFLGDMTLWRGTHQRAAFQDLIRGLPGHKTLFLGNHDHYDVRVYREVFEKVRTSNKFEGCLLTHYPIHPGSLGFGTLANIHGHIHRTEVRGADGTPDPRYVNVSAEVIGYRPVDLEQVLEELRAKKQALLEKTEEQHVGTEEAGG